MLVRNLLLFLLFLFLARAIWRFVNGVLQGAVTTGGSASRSAPPPPPAMQMVIDPVCGTYVVPGKALQLMRGGHTVYFCSDTCRNRYTG